MKLCRFTILEPLPRFEGSIKFFIEKICLIAARMGKMNQEKLCPMNTIPLSHIITAVGITIQEVIELALLNYTLNIQKIHSGSSRFVLFASLSFIA